MNWYEYANSNPLRYVDPDGLSADDALRYLNRYAETIGSLEQEYDLPHGLLQSVVWNENNRRGFWSAAKDLAGLLRNGQASLGVAQVQMATAAFLDSNPSVSDVSGLDSRGFEALKQAAFKQLSQSEQNSYSSRLQDPEVCLRYSARYLAFIGEAGGFSSETSKEWLSAYNIGKSRWGEVAPYGQGFLGYESLSWWERIKYGVINLFDPYGDGWE